MIVACLSSAACRLVSRRWEMLPTSYNPYEQRRLRLLPTAFISDQFIGSRGCRPWAARWLSQWILEQSICVFDRCKLLWHRCLVVRLDYHLIQIVSKALRDASWFWCIDSPCLQGRRLKEAIRIACWRRRQPCQSLQLWQNTVLFAQAARRMTFVR